MAGSTTLRGALIGAVVLLLVQPASAHHSQAMFDVSKTMTLVGTVKEFQWGNPHCYIQVLVPSEAQPNSAQEWSVEMGAPAHLVRAGWKPGSLKAGDKITVSFNPLRDGGLGGHYLSAIGPDGRSLDTSP
jgi:hypothetical protein